MIMKSVCWYMYFYIFFKSRQHMFKSGAIICAKVQLDTCSVLQEHGSVTKSQIQSGEDWAICIYVTSTSAEVSLLFVPFCPWICPLLLLLEPLFHNPSQQHIHRVLLFSLQLRRHFKSLHEPRNFSSFRQRVNHYVVLNQKGLTSTAI